MSTAPRDTIRGFTLIEVAVSTAMVSVLLAILLPALSAARVTSQREQCDLQQRAIGTAWFTYLADHDDAFPSIGSVVDASGRQVPDAGRSLRWSSDPAWGYGGVRFSAIDDAPFLDNRRPLNQYMSSADAFMCPADHGITGESGESGTAGKTAHRVYGTSYRALAGLCDCTRAGLDCGERRGLHLSELGPMMHRQALMGDPIWYEVRENTGRRAAWHGHEDRGNVLFLDGSVRFVQIEPRPRTGVVLFEPQLRPSLLTEPVDEP